MHKVRRREVRIEEGGEDRKRTEEGGGRMEEGGGAGGQATCTYERYIFCKLYPPAPPDRSIK